ncbi:MAG: hypothetical protein IAE77_29560 [Prosthecobacter sp.]|uniref:hypothetical protein n=1 Tax=Prosthecobacter sp. TaxID=1965333 RepID=UPI0019DB6D2A|nr:hypothetical protein [Prosthecobacter sp.]MBE2287641.1 hypothetical protein [Prosthecobacter sp.]
MNPFWEQLLGRLLGPLGTWSVRVATLNRCRPDPESWGMIGLGWLILVAVIVGCAFAAN